MAGGTGLGMLPEVLADEEAVNTGRWISSLASML
jgi:hypothetical protein